MAKRKTDPSRSGAGRRPGSDDGDQTGARPPGKKRAGRKAKKEAKDTKKAGKKAGKTRKKLNKTSGGKKSGGKHEADENTSRGGGHTPTFPIVGIGASAGGIEAFTTLLRNLPTDTGMAFVFVQHLHPGHESALSEILGRETAMPVEEAADHMTVQPDHVYVMPSDSYLGILHGALQLLPRADTNERRLPIDQFFRYLAEDHGSRAIGVILSGTASDGVLGLKAIKAEGGLTFAQSEASAKYNGMPHSAIASGAVDVVQPPDQIAAEIARIASHPYLLRERGGVPEALPPGGDALDKIFMLMRRYRGHDFTYYKHTTIQRRIRRRMLLHKLADLNDYVRYLQEHPVELDDLFQDMLINVTGFFRDPEVYDALAEKAFPAMLRDSPPERPVRIWVTGCSTGEEAYSIAIAFAEFLGERATKVPVQVFATDIDETAINRARAGIYPENIAQDLNAKRLRQFFSKVEGGYQVSKTIRDMCVFAVQNAIKDPPFSRLDLISCRNLLIYLGPVLQKRLMRVFHYALKPGGFLLLGTAESIGKFSDLFRQVDSKDKIYARKPASAHYHVEFGTDAQPPPAPDPEGKRPEAEQPDATHRLNIQREADQVLMNRYGPAGVVINEDMEILFFRGRTGPYLEPAPGEASFNLLKMARDDLVVGLNNAVREAVAGHASVSRRDTRLQVNGDARRVDIEVTPLSGTREQGRHYLVVFRKLDGPPDARDKAARRTSRKKDEAKDETEQEEDRLRQELAATREYLQSVIEQQESNNEELRSANEEVQSSNEELQSINEELETAKEELQSSNEELATVNDELEKRNAELSRANDDLTNLVASVNIATVMVGLDLRVRRFTPQAGKLLNLIGTDVGRPIGDIKPNIEVPELEKTLNETMEDMQTRAQDVQDNTGLWYSMEVRPYRTADNKIDGAVVVFIKEDAMKRALDAARAARDYAEAVVAAVRHPMLVLDGDLRVVSASAAYLEAFQVKDRETRGNPVHRLGSGQWADPGLRDRLAKVAREDGDGGFDNCEVTHEFEQLGIRTFAVSGRRIPAGLPDGPMVVMQIEDVTGHERSRSQT